MADNMSEKINVKFEPCSSKTVGDICILVFGRLVLEHGLRRQFSQNHVFGPSKPQVSANFYRTNVKLHNYLLRGLVHNSY